MSDGKGGSELWCCTFGNRGLALHDGALWLNASGLDRDGRGKGQEGIYACTTAQRYECI